MKQPFTSSREEGRLQPLAPRAAGWSSFYSRFVLLLVIAAPAGPAATAPSQPLEWLEARREQQSKINAGVFRDFRFADKSAESAIQFQHRAVADANKYYKAIHYDHGCGMAVTDVDGDGRLDIYFVSQLGGNELWRNVGGGRFENITESAGVSLKDRVSVAASFADIDNDGDADLFVTTVRFGNALFENTGRGQFRDITAQAGVAYTGHSSGATFFDYDNDGLLDLYVCNVGHYTTNQKGEGGYFVGLTDGFKGHLHPERSERSLLYRNLGGRKFKEVGREVGLHDALWSGDATFADLNNDRFPDLYVLNMQGDDRLYENRGGKEFTNRTPAYFPKTPWGSMGVKFFDFNQDGRTDVFITDMHSDMTGLQTKASKSNFRSEFEKARSEAMCMTEWTDAYLQGASNNVFGNAFYLNRASPAFAETSQELGAETLWPWGISVADVNADGFEDAFVTAGMGFGFRYAVNSLLLNDRGRRFADSEFVVGIEPRAHGRTDKVAFVLECSGADKDHPYCAGRSGRIPVRETLSSRSSAIFDIDDDGDLDIVTNEMNDGPQILLSNIAAVKRIRFVKIKLVGARSNRDGLGATVRVHVAGRTLTQYSDGKSGYLSQSSMPLYFGLDEAERIDAVEVLWPSGGKQRIEKELAINTLLTIQEERP